MSETPRVDAALDELAENQRGAVHYNGGTFIDIARQLERELRQAQEERDLHYGRLAGLLFSGALDKYTGADVQLWAKEYGDKLTQAQARCAELEKDAARYRWWRDKFFGSDEELDEINALTAEGLNGWDAAIDKAIKRPR